MKTVLLGALLFLGACDQGVVKTDDTDGTTDGTADTDTNVAGADTDLLGECDTTNEDCAEGVRGCGGEGSTMLPGANCLACHTPGQRAPTWTAGGTIFTDASGLRAAKNVTITITDDAGKVVTMTSNSVGNFYTSKSLTFPINVEIEKNGVKKQMATAVDEGGCNACHSCEGEAGGKLFAP